jgi:hypothetical protein
MTTLTQQPKRSIALRHAPDFACAEDAVCLANRESRSM